MMLSGSSAKRSIKSACESRFFAVMDIFGLMDILVVIFLEPHQTKVGSAGEHSISDKSVDRYECQTKEIRLHSLLIIAEVCHALKNTSINFIFRIAVKAKFIFIIIDCMQSQYLKEVQDFLSLIMSIKPEITLL
jgi:hypothetical protein